MAHVVYDPNEPCPSIVDFDIEEPCPHCGEYIPVKIDAEAVPQVICPVCGGVVILCTNCPDDCYGCDWSEKDICHVIRDWGKEDAQ